MLQHTVYVVKLSFTTEARVLTAFHFTTNQAFRLYPCRALVVLYATRLAFISLKEGSKPAQIHNGNRGGNGPDAVHQESGSERDRGASVRAVCAGEAVAKGRHG